MNEDFKRILIDDLNLDEEALNPDNSLERAGLDSLSIVELSVSLSQQLGVEINEEDLQKAPTLGELERLVQQRRTAGRTG